MTEPRTFPFGGIPVYNPQSLSRTEAIAQFHVRQATYSSLLELLREERPSHVLLIGARGMGKTTLLQRVRYGVEDDPDLSSRYMVLVFPEEQYNVNRLHHFLLNTIDALADAMERSKNPRVLARVEEFIGVIGSCAPEQIENQVPQFLAEISRQMASGILLLVDNADRLFETIDDGQQWRFRELLSTRRDLTFFGATTQASEGIYGPDRAFFEFFKIYQLAPLTLPEVRGLLLRLSESLEENENEKGAAKKRVADWLDADAARLRTLVQLTGGNPRTTVLLFHLVLDGLAGGAREYLEQLLDQVTPGYKGRVDELPSQAQQVLDAVALRWDPVTAVEVHDDTGLETSAVSTQLTRLVRQGILEKADPGDSRKAMYQVAERFFNIWYLMRASRRVRAKLRWFVEFLRVFFDSNELEKMARERVERHRGAWRERPEEIETLFAYVLASGTPRTVFENYLRQKCSERGIQEMRPHLDLMVEANRAGESAAHGQVQAETEAEIRRALEIEPEDASLWKKLGRLLAREPDRALDAEAAYLKAIHLRPSSGLWRKLGSLLAETPQRAEEAEVAFRNAVALDPKDARSRILLGSLLFGMPGRADDAETEARKAIELEPNRAPFWAILGACLGTRTQRADEAEMASRKAIELDPNASEFWGLLGALLGRRPERAEEAESAYRKAIELDPNAAASWGGLGDLLGRRAERAAEAELAYRKALELDPKAAASWGSLGDLLGKRAERAAEAELAYRRALELDPNDVSALDGLGSLLRDTPERLDEAEMAYRKALDLEPANPWIWSGLGYVLIGNPERVDEAEIAFRKAIALDPEVAPLWGMLGALLAMRPERADEAEIAARKAIELDPIIAPPWRLLGMLLASNPERAEKAESAYRKALEMDPKDAEGWMKLGALLREAPGRMEDAETAYRKAIELDRENPSFWGSFAVFLACRAGKTKEAEIAFRSAVFFGPEDSANLRSFGVFLFCGLAAREEAVTYLRRALELAPEDRVSAAIFAAAVRNSETVPQELPISIDATREADFWSELLELCQNYPPFGELLLGICELVQERDDQNRFVGLYRAVALAQLQDFPRASVALEDALNGDPIELFSVAQSALETFLAAAVKNGRVRDCVELIDKKGWKDAWRPIYEALQAVESGSAEYLKRVAVEIRDPALAILRRISPRLQGLRELKTTITPTISRASVRS